MAISHLILVFCLLIGTTLAFVPPQAFRNALSGQNVPTRAFLQRSDSSSSSRLFSTSSPRELARRQELLGRTGPYFGLDRFSGNVEFGATADLVTQLNPTEPDLERIQEWLADERRVALSIWDEKLIQECGNQVFRLQTMKLQFVTILLSPSVDMRMWTEVDKTTGSPTFRLQSVGFDPNIQLLPGIGVSAESLGINIEVAGIVQPTTDGKGVTGKITFATSGNLPPPMRVLPDPILKGASDTINNTITQFAIQSFRREAVRKYREFVAASTTPSTQ